MTRRISDAGWTDQQALVEGMRALGMVPSLWACASCGDTRRVWTEPLASIPTPRCCGNMEVWDGRPITRKRRGAQAAMEPLDPL